MNLQFIDILKKLLMKINKKSNILNISIIYFNVSKQKKKHPNFPEI